MEGEFEGERALIAELERAAPEMVDQLTQQHAMTERLAESTLRASILKLLSHSLNATQEVQGRCRNLRRYFQVSQLDQMTSLETPAAEAVPAAREAHST